MSPVNWLGPMITLPLGSTMRTSLNVADALMLVLLLELTAKPTKTVGGSPAVNTRPAPVTEPVADVYEAPPSSEKAAWYALPMRVSFR